MQVRVLLGRRRSVMHQAPMRQTHPRRNAIENTSLSRSIGRTGPHHQDARKAQSAACGLGQRIRAGLFSTRHALRQTCPVAAADSASCVPLGPAPWGRSNVGDHASSGFVVSLLRPFTPPRQDVGIPLFQLPSASSGQPVFEMIRLVSHDVHDVGLLWSSRRW